MNRRPDLELIARLIPKQTRVLDLGCGNGELMQLLAAKGCTGTGVEIDPEAINTALASGIDVIELDVNTQLSEFSAASYDVVVLAGTLQNLEKPMDVLAEIARIGRQLVVSMPNFVHWRNRLRLLGGRMPVSHSLPFQWYDTPNIHYTSLKDLEPCFAELGLHIETRVPLDAQGNAHRLGELAPNLYASSAVYVLSQPS